MSTLIVKVTTGRAAADLKTNLQSAADKHSVVNRVAQYITSTHTGSQEAESATQPPSINIQVQDNTARATGTFTFSAAATANDTVLINGVTFTAVASGATGNQWNVGASATATATNLAAAINASVTALVSGYVTATSALGVVTVKSVFYGTAGNMVTIAKGVDAGSVITVSGARLTGGAVDAGALTLNF